MPSKSIAVPPNPSARKGRRLPAPVDEPAFEPMAAPVLRQAPRPVLAQPTHRYRVGERLRMGNGGNVLARASAACKVISLLPYEGRGPLLYRVRSDAEAFERVVAEADLSHA